MSIVPFLLSDVLDELAHPPNLFDQHFGVGLLADDLINPRTLMQMPMSRGYCRPWRHLHARDSGVSNIQNSANEFKVNLDVQQFKPDQLNVKVVDNTVVIDGKHEERKDEHGFISRQFQRRYLLPDNVDPATVVSSLSSDGVLTISAPKKTLPLQQNERAVPITQTGEPAIQQKKPEKAGGDNQNMEQ